MNDIFSGALRLGFLPNDSTLVYGNLGIPFSKFNNVTSYNTLQTSTIPVPTVITNNNSTTSNSYHTGYLLGLGVEHYVCNSLTVFVNYRYNHFKTDNVNIVETEVNQKANVFTSHSITQHNFLIGVNSRFEV